MRYPLLFILPGIQEVRESTHYDSSAYLLQVHNRVTSLYSIYCRLLLIFEIIFDFLSEYLTIIKLKMKKKILF